MAKAVTSAVELVNRVTSDYVNWFHFAMWGFASKCVPIELVPCSDGWRRSWWQMKHMIPGLLVSSIPQCKWNCHEDTCLESFQGIGLFEPTFIEAYQASKMICKVRSLKSQIKTRSFLEEIITSSNEAFKDLESDMVVGSRKLGNLTRNTAECYGRAK